VSTDLLVWLPESFGSVLTRLRQKRNWETESLANASGLSAQEIRSIEAGAYTPTLKDFFRLAIGLGESPVILLLEVITAGRVDPTDYGLYKSRPSDLTRLYRLGYFRDPGDFRELPTAYGLLDDATAAARALNTTRHSKGMPLLETVLLYVRFGNIRFQPDTVAKKKGIGKEPS
jgi:transcriptional regulator with XRE-family HTH domain